MTIIGVNDYLLLWFVDINRHNHFNSSFPLYLGYG